MSYEMTVWEKAGYLHIRVTGENSPETVRGYLAGIYLLTCSQRNCSSVLIEEDLQGPGLGLFDVFEIASVGSAQPLPHVRRIACVDVNGEHSPTNRQFAETVAVNRGINIRLFSVAHDAEEWLREAATG